MMDSSIVITSEIMEQSEEQQKYFEKLLQN